MDEKVIQGVIDGIDNVKESRGSLTYQLDHVTELKKQVSESVAISLLSIKDHFQTLRNEMNKIMEARQTELEKEVKELAKKDFDALGDIEEELQSLIVESVQIMEKGKNLLIGEHDENSSGMVSYASQAKSVYLQCSLIIPPVQEVACLHVDLPGGIMQEMNALLEDYGTAFARAPVQITEIAERPGGLMVKWGEIDEEQALDLKEFCLQYCHGNIKPNSQNEDTYKEVYKGNNTSVCLTGLDKHKPYSLRVCGRAEGAEVWSPWSIPLSASTILPHYEFSIKDGDSSYILSDHQKIAEKVSCAESLVLCGRQYLQCGHSIKFKILEAGPINPSDGIFLSNNQDVDTQLKCQNRLLLTTQGKIYVDGVEKLTSFPALSTKSIVTFNTQIIQENKVRIDIEVNDHNVAFDWTINVMNNVASGMPLGTKNDNPVLYFGALFSSSGWKVAVE